MKNIYDLITINKRYQKVIQSLVPRSNSSPLKKLMTLAITKKGLSDYDCMLEIYGKINVSAFSELKNKFREILHKVTLLQNDLSGNNDSLINSYINISRQILIARILMTKNENAGGEFLLEKAINNSIKYNLTEHILMQSLAIIRKNASGLPDDYQFNKYSSLHKIFLDIYYWESKAELFYYELKNHQYTSLANASSLLKEKAARYVNELSTVNKIETSKFIYNKYRVSALYYEFSKDYNSLLQISDVAISKFAPAEQNSIIYLNNIYIRKIYALIQANYLDKAIEFGYSILPNILSDSSNWVRINYYIIKGLFYIGQYLDGIKLLSILIINYNTQRRNKIFTELINILTGYSYILIQSGFVNEFDYSGEVRQEFKLGKFLNTLPVFSKDKHGINVSILLLHIAILLQRKDYNAIIDRTDALNQYAYRYLRRDDSFRSNCMIKMVIQMAKADFHPIRTERYTADLLKQLKSVPLAGSGENIEIEFIPFEVLWEIMVKSLNKG